MKFSSILIVASIPSIVNAYIRTRGSDGRELADKFQSGNARTLQEVEFPEDALGDDDGAAMMSNTTDDATMMMDAEMVMEDAFEMTMDDDAAAATDAEVTSFGAELSSKATKQGKSMKVGGDKLVKSNKSEKESNAEGIETKSAKGGGGYGTDKVMKSDKESKAGIFKSKATKAEGVSSKSMKSDKEPKKGAEKKMKSDKAKTEKESKVKVATKSGDKGLVEKKAKSIKTAKEGTKLVKTAKEGKSKEAKEARR
mmetsp:Transcript_9705/g.10890  ORF Transcript_9705/g.10890 Transcript_9705/m.10890 type:complete len:254 (-) Transcript_9705:338-1099(-)